MFCRASSFESKHLHPSKIPLILGLRFAIKRRKTVGHITDMKFFFPMFTVDPCIHVPQLPLDPRRFHLRMDVRVAFSL